MRNGCACQTKIVIHQRHLLSLDDIQPREPGISKPRRGDLMIRFKLAAEVGGLLETQFQRDHLDREAGTQQWPSSPEPLLIQPVLRCAPELAAEDALELTHR